MQVIDKGRKSANPFMEVVVPNTFAGTYFGVRSYPAKVPLKQDKQQQRYAGADFIPLLLLQAQQGLPV